MKRNIKKDKGPIYTSTTLELHKVLDLSFNIQAKMVIECFKKRESYAWELDIDGEELIINANAWYLILEKESNIHLIIKVLDSG